MLQDKVEIIITSVTLQKIVQIEQNFDSLTFILIRLGYCFKNIFQQNIFDIHNCNRVFV